MPYWDASLGNGYYLRLHANQTSPNHANNSSDVAWSLELVRTGGSMYASGYQNSWSVNINGAPSSGARSYDFRGGVTSVLLGSGAITVPHNSDGTKSISVSASYNDIANQYLSDGSVSGTLTLSTIPRGSTPRPTNLANINQSHYDAGVTMRIWTDRASTNFTHTVRYTFGEASGTIATGVTDSVDWAIPLNLLNQMPNAATGYGTLWLDTYSGSTLIQTKGAPFAVRVPASVVPTVGTISHSEATSGLAANVGAYVQNLTTLLLAVSGEAGVYGSTITERRWEVGGQVFTGDPVTTAVITSSGTVPLKLTVTDSRGQKASSTVNLTFLAYAPPKINSLTVQRSLSSGTPDEAGTFLRVNFNSSVSSLVNSTQRNAMRYTIYVRPRGQASWGTAKSNVLLPTGTVSFNSYVNLSGYLSGTAYDVRLDITDDFGTTSQERQVPTAQIAVHFDGNLGMGIGKYRENGMLDVMGAIYQNNGKAVLDTGTATSFTAANFGSIISGGTVTSFVGYKIGRLLFFAARFDYTADIPHGGTGIFTVNSPYRPLGGFTVALTGIASGGPTSAAGIGVGIDSVGRIIVMSPDRRRAVEISGCWITA